MSRILITGTNSFVGTNIIRYSKYREIDEISLFDHKPEEIDFSKYDIVIHLVAIVHQKISIPEKEYMKINRDLCLDTAKNAKKGGVKQFIFLSSVKVYGKYIHGKGAWNEFSECHPDDSYGISKYEAEKGLRQLEDKNFRVSIVRTPLVYGDGVRANMLSIIKLIKTIRILPFKNIRNKRNFSCAQNLAAFIDRIIERNSSGTFIAMDKEAISTTELTEIISDTLKIKVILFKIPDPFIELAMILLPSVFERLYGSFEMDNSWTLEALDFEPPVTIKEGLRNMVLSFIESDHTNIPS